jgi:hypothetical protein
MSKKDERSDDLKSRAGRAEGLGCCFWFLILLQTHNIQYLMTYFSIFLSCFLGFLLYAV